MVLSTSAGTTLHIHAPVNGTDAATLDALPGWVEIGDVSNIGDIGESFDIQWRTYFENGPRAEPMITISSSKTVSLDIAHVSGDAGQQAVKSAVGGRTPYLFKAELHDKLVNSHRGTRIIFRALVLEALLTIGDASSITRRSVTIQPTGEIWELPTGPV